MLELPIGKFVSVHERLIAIGQTIILQDGPNRSLRFQEAVFQGLVRDAEDFCDLCVGMDLTVTHGAAKALAEELRRAQAPNSQGIRTLNAVDLVRLHPAFSVLSGCLKHESATKVALSVPPDKAHLYSPGAPLFGVDVSNAFASMEYDIEEAGKCLALERGTACVFHLMRTTECAIGATARCLGIPDPVKSADKNWGAISRTIQSELKARTTASPPRWAKPDDKAFFDEIFVLMEAVRAVWRNPTMHPDKKYTPEEAQDIFLATKTFMKKISSRLDENGEPRA